MTKPFSIFNLIGQFSLYRQRWFVEYVTGGKSTLEKGKVTPPASFDIHAQKVQYGLQKIKNADLYDLLLIYEPRNKYK